mmetsp:Transcript_36748/g.97874  ORF Transcript_36748/g.97874 Transcript_36748/m.97874 type:complete len:213 (+) Transcript_36748:188-826(+)
MRAGFRAEIHAALPSVSHVLCFDIVGRYVCALIGLVTTPRQSVRRLFVPTPWLLRKSSFSTSLICISMEPFRGWSLVSSIRSHASLVVSPRIFFNAGKMQDGTHSLPSPVREATSVKNRPSSRNTCTSTTLSNTKGLSEVSNSSPSVPSRTFFPSNVCALMLKEYDFAMSCNSMALRMSGDKDDTISLKLVFGTLKSLGYSSSGGAASHIRL